MVLFKSKDEVVNVPENLTVWEWLFESQEYSPLSRLSEGQSKSFIDAETQESLNWHQIKSKSTALSTCWVRRHGLKPDNTVSIFSGNSIWYPVCMLAAVRAGARINGASAVLTINEIAYALKVAESKIVVTAQSVAEKVIKAAAQAGIPQNNIFLLQGSSPEVQAIQEIIKHGASLPTCNPYTLAAGESSKNICGFLNFSSGTTGLPKPVMLSHYNVIVQCHISREAMPDAHTMTMLAVLPLYHIIGTWRLGLWPMFLNTDCVILPSFSMARMLKAIVDFNVEEVILVPPIILRLAQDSIVDDYDLRRLKQITSGAAPISTEVLKLLERRLPWATYRSGYGATEAPVVTTVPKSHWGYKYAASVGMLQAGTEAKVIDPEGNLLGVCQPGELLIRGPQVAMGYLNDRKATEESFDREGFYHTGDAGYFDQEGLLYISDRIKELIKVKGIQVAPAELENLLLGHEIVADCAVIGQPDEYAGELPKAYVVLKGDILPTNVEGQRLLQYVKENKTKYKWLTEIEFVSGIPKSPAGKLLRKVLREMDQQGCTSVGKIASYLRPPAERGEGTIVIGPDSLFDEGLH